MEDGDVVSDKSANFFYEVVSSMFTKIPSEGS